MKLCPPPPPPTSETEFPPLETGVYNSFPAELVIIDTPTKTPIGLGGISNEGHILKQLLRSGGKLGS